MDDKLLKLVAGVISSSLLFESCTNNVFLDGAVDEINQNLPIHNFNSIAIPIKAQLSESNVQYVDFLQKLAYDILQNPEIAQDFINNPTTYVNQNGFSINFNTLDNKLTQLILALADQEICNAIKSQNIRQYLSLMRSKGFINDISITDIDDLSAIGDKLYDINNVFNNDSIDASASLFFFGFVVGVLIAVWACAVEHVFLGNAVAVGTVFKIAAAVNTVTLGEQTHKINEALLASNAIEVFSIKSMEDVDTQIVIDLYIEESVNSAMSYLKEYYPAEINKYDEVTLKNAIFLNIQKQRNE